MKKILLTLLTGVLISSAAFAQSFNLGIKAGVNLSKINSDFAKEENRLGYQVGAWARFGGSFYLQPEAYIGSKGNKFISVTQNSGTEVTAEGKVKFTTLDIPLLLGTRLVGSNNVNIRFMAGPVVSFVLDEKSDFSAAYDQATDFKNYKNQTWGGQVGAGVDLGNISVDLRYEAGFSNISKSEKYKQTPNLFQLSLGIKLL